MSKQSLGTAFGVSFMRWMLCALVGLTALGGLAGPAHGRVRPYPDETQTPPPQAGSAAVIRNTHAVIRQVVWREIRAGSFPGAVVLVGQGNRIVYFEAFGDRCVQPQRRLMQKNTLFDLASLTKPLATAPAVLLLAERGQLSLDDHVRVYLPTFACGGKQDVRIRHLLTHTSGLPAYTSAAPLEKRFGPGCRDAVLGKICGLRAMNGPGETFRYSCLGYITLARIVEIVTGRPFDAFIEHELYRPLGMYQTQFTPLEDSVAEGQSRPSAFLPSAFHLPPVTPHLMRGPEHAALAWAAALSGQGHQSPDAFATIQGRIAATQVVDGQPLRGIVHDPLARLAGGVSGNAGLFSTARDLSLFCRMLLNGGELNGRRVLSAESVRLLTTEQSHGRAYGFDVSSGYAWLKGAYGPAEAFCHSGYTGTSLVCDPCGGVYIIILTNSVHPDDAGKTRAVRVGVADIVFRACGYARRGDSMDGGG